MSALIDLTGRRFNRLLALARVPTTSHGTSWLCKCDCGNYATVKAGMLTLSTRRPTESCGCLARETARDLLQTHGYASHAKGKTSTYLTWVDMNARCYNPKHRAYRYYGERGVTVCERWRDSFPAFLEDMGERPEGRYPSGRALYSIDRINNDGNYEPGNCRWATSSQQNSNQRRQHRDES